MTPQRWQRILELFHGARELPSEDRAEYLRRACGGDSGLVQEIQAMLDEEGRPGLLDSSPWSPTHSWQGQTSEPAPEAASPPPAFEPGQTLGGRYRIVRFVNRGGMGEVYEAQDLELEERVALKTLLPAIARDVRMIARFKQELQLSRKIGHPNVCRVFDLARHPADGSTSSGPTYFLTMEFLEGETLSDRLAREGRLTPETAIPLIAQMAAGLAAAHAAGVIHRDFKPSNVMLLASGETARAVITDFGLARSFTPDEAAATHGTHLMGTLEYMAPELLSGQAAGTASDVYSLGIVMGLMLTGELQTRTTIASPPRGSVLTRLPAMRHLVSRCLAPDAPRRPGLAQILRAMTAAQPFRGAGVRSRWLAICVLAALILALGLAAFRYYRQGLQLRPGSLVYLMEMNNATEDPELDSAGDLLRNHLLQSGHVRLLDGGRATRIRALISSGGRQPGPGAMAREVALRAGAVLVVFSTLARVADSYNLSVEIQRVGSSPVAARQKWRNDWPTRSKPQIFVAIREAGDWIRSVSGESSAALAERDVAPEEAASSSWEALRLYRESEALKSSGDADTAMALLRRAIDLDSDFALAHVRLADLLNSKRRQEEAFEHYRLALEAAGKRRLTRWEELRLRGTYALDLGDRPAAEAAFTELRTWFPNDPLPPHYLASALQTQGRVEEAATLEQEALAKAPDATPPVVTLLNDYVLLGRLDEAEAQARKLGDLGAQAMSLEYRGIVQYIRGDATGARSLFEAVLRDPAPVRRSHARSLLGALEAEAGHYRQALSFYDDGLQADLAAGMPGQAAQKHLATGTLYLRMGQLTEARNQALEAVRLLRNLETYRRAGTILARAGFTADARALLDDLGPGWPGPLAETVRDLIRGEILLQQRNTAAAVAEIEAADHLESPLRVRGYLARAYAVAGDRERAMFLYRTMLRSWAPFWYYADCELPALRTATELDYAELALELHHPEEARGALSEYAKARPDGDPELPETRNAQRLTLLLTNTPTNGKE